MLLFSQGVSFANQRGKLSIERRKAVTWTLADDFWKRKFPRRSLGITSKVFAMSPNTC
jgi:hypothetical protein